MEYANNSTDKIANNDLNKLLGQERLKADKRQLGGLLMLLGTSALVFPMANVSTLVSPDGETESEGIQLCSLIAGIFVISMGVISIPLGYLQAVHDWGNHHLTGLLIVWTQLAWLPFLTDLTAVGKDTRSGAAFIPSALNPTEGDVKFVGAMGMMGILGYGTGFLGSLAFVEFCLFAFQAGTPGDRPGWYYRGRMRTYTFCNLLVGSSQLMLGSYVLAKFGNGPILPNPVAVAMYRVHFPEISIAVGSVQTLNALYGIVRSFGLHGGEDDHRFQVTTLIQWVCTVSLQILTQVSYSPAGAAAAAAPSQTMLTMGISVIVAYLDYKGRTTPDLIPDNYYGLDEHRIDDGRKTNDDKDDVHMDNEFSEEQGDDRREPP